MKALIFGITGQDGSYMSELLLNKGYDVYGVVRRSSCNNLIRLKNVIGKVTLFYGDVTDGSSIYKIVSETIPDEIYNFAAQSYVKASFEMPEYSGDVNAIGTVRILEAVKTLCPKCRVYNACTSEMYGNSDTEFNPVSPYGIAKLYSYHMCKMYREAYGIYVVNGIAFNHESPRRGEEFVTKKICHDIIKHGSVQLGNIESVRDWGYAPDYVEGMWMSLQMNNPDDYTFATGESHSVKEFCDEVLNVLNIEHHWDNGFCIRDSDDMVVVKPYTGLLRPIDINKLCGDYAKTKNKLGWYPKTGFKELVKIMTEYELNGKEQ